MDISFVRLKKLWYSGGNKFVAVVALVLAIVLLVAGLASFVFARWVDGIAAFVAGSPLLITSWTLFVSAQNAPQTTLCTCQDDINSFLANFIRAGSSAHIASYRLSWLRSNEPMVDLLIALAAQGNLVRLFAAGPPDDLIQRLQEGDVRVTTYPTDVVAPPRFTFLNYGRAGAQTLAVARSGLPEHWIDVYREAQSPQVIAIARAYLDRLENMG